MAVDALMGSTGPGSFQRDIDSPTLNTQPRSPKHISFGRVPFALFHSDPPHPLEVSCVEFPASFCLCAVVARAADADRSPR